MAIQLSGNTVITDSAGLKHVANTSYNTNLTLASALRQDNDYVKILDSSGNEIHIVWGGTG